MLHRHKGLVLIGVRVGGVLFLGLGVGVHDLLRLVTFLLGRQ